MIQPQQSTASKFVLTAGAVFLGALMALSVFCGGAYFWFRTETQSNVNKQREKIAEQIKANEKWAEKIKQANEDEQK